MRRLDLNTKTLFWTVLKFWILNSGKRSVSRVLEQHFGDCIILRHFPFRWPSRSSDLTPIDFSVWGYMKSKIYICSPQTLSELKDSIKCEIANILHTILRLALLSTISRMQCLIACDGTHVENV